MKKSGDSFIPDPALGGFFGIGILAAAAKDLPSGLFLGFGVAVSAAALGTIVPALRKQLSPRFLEPTALAVSTASALAYGLAVEAFFPAHSIAMWMYIPLLAVNCLSLHAIRRGSDRQLHAAPDSTQAAQIARGAVSYFLIAVLLGAFREMVGMGTISLPTADSAGSTLMLAHRPPLRMASSPAGGFIILGFLSALYRSSLRSRGKRIP